MYIECYSTFGKTEHVEYRELAFDDWCCIDGIRVTFIQWPKNTCMTFQNTRQDSSDKTVYIVVKHPHKAFRRAVETGGLVRIMSNVPQVTIDENYLETAARYFIQWCDGKELFHPEELRTFSREDDEMLACIYGYDGDHIY